jgi:3-methyladenine DNA glycosylase AlkD
MCNIDAVHNERSIKVRYIAYRGKPNQYVSAELIQACCPHAAEKEFRTKFAYGEILNDLYWQFQEGHVTVEELAGTPLADIKLRDYLDRKGEAFSHPY